MSGDTREPLMQGWNEFLKDAESFGDRMPPIDEWYGIWKSGTTAAQAVEDYGKPEFVCPDCGAELEEAQCEMRFTIRRGGSGMEFFPVSELHDKIMKRFRNRETCSIELNGRIIGEVWKSYGDGNPGIWRWFHESELEAESEECGCVDAEDSIAVTMQELAEFHGDEQRAHMRDEGRWS